MAADEGGGGPGPVPPVPALPALAPAGREAGAGYAAAARALSAVPPLGRGAAEAASPDDPVLRAGAWREAGAEPLLPGGGGGLALPLALALLRPEPVRWLGAAALEALAQAHGLEAGALAALLEAAPAPPAMLGDPSLWSGRSVPLLGPEGELLWMSVFWRPDRAGRALRPDRHALAVRLHLPATGRIEWRARLEEERLDAVMETERPLARNPSADLQEAFHAVLAALRLQGSLTVRHADQGHGT